MLLPSLYTLPWLQVLFSSIARLMEKAQCPCPLCSAEIQETDYPRLIQLTLFPNSKLHSVCPSCSPSISIRTDSCSLHWKAATYCTWFTHTFNMRFAFFARVFTFGKLKHYQKRQNICSLFSCKHVSMRRLATEINISERYILYSK